MPVDRQESEDLGDECQGSSYLERLNFDKSTLSSGAVMRSTS